jgi:D-sedoheptulose 7-phosphate isomerase
MKRREEQLRELYPFLQQRAQDAPGAAPVLLESVLLESVMQKAAHSIEIKRQFFAEQGTAVVRAAAGIATVYRRGGRMLTMGNGGSACDAAHFAVEFLHPLTAGRPALAALDLARDSALLTAVGNDVGFEHVFVRQLLALARPLDGLIGFSTSGNSVNLLRAFAKAREMGLLTLALTGGDGGRLAQSNDIDHCLVVATDSIHRVQEVHVAIYHILWDLVHTLLAADRGSLEATE